MKKSRFTEAQIVDALKRHEAGRSIAELARELGVTPATLYQWRKESAGVETSELKRLKSLEAENAKLKRMYHDLSTSKAYDLVSLSTSTYHYRSTRDDPEVAAAPMTLRDRHPRRGFGVSYN